MSPQCPRCLTRTNGVHTCTPTAEFGALELRIAELEAENAKLTAHIRTIAEHHVDAIGEILPTHYQTERHDFALSIFKEES